MFAFSDFENKQNALLEHINIIFCSTAQLTPLYSLWVLRGWFEKWFDVIEEKIGERQSILETEPIFLECLTTGLVQDYWRIYLKRVRLRIQKCPRNVISSLHSHDRQAGCSKKTRMQSSAGLQPSPWFFESVSWVIHPTRHVKRGWPLC